MEGALQPGDPERIGPYRVIRPLGSGGMGRVYLGRSAGGRSVAIKVIRAELAADPEFRSRFRHEVAAAQRVNGLFTALVVQADTEGPVPWLATAYVPGPTLAEAVTGHGPLSAAAVLALAAGLAEGLAAIHAAGLVHRDLKPSNVLLADDGPRVIDFGISRAAEGASVLTHTGFMVGSPGFMSPEQAEGRHVGPASDVFSLGAVLTFAATGRGPFGAGSTAALVYRVVHAAPDLDGVPAEIRSLAARCLAKDPAQRPTAAALLAELGGGGVAAGGGWGVTPAQTSAQPHVTAGAQAPAAGNVPWWKESPVVQEQLRQQGQAPRPGTVRRPGPGRPGSWLGSRLGSWLGSRLGPGRPRAIAAGVGAAVIALVVVLVVVVLPGGGRDSIRAALADPHSNFVYGVAFSPDGRLVAAADGNGSSYLWNVSTGKLTATLKDPGSSGVSVDAFSPNGSLLSAADGDGSAYLWNVASGKMVATFTDPDSKGMIASTFSPDGSLLATADDNGYAYLWNVSTGKMVASYADQSSMGVNYVAFSPDGKLLAAADQNGSTYLWNLSTGTVSATIPDPDSKGIISAVFSTDGSLLVTADGNGSSYVWNVASGNLVATLKDPGSKGVDDAAFSPDSDLVAAADANGNAYLWNVSAGKLVATLKDPHSKGLFDASFSPDGGLLALADGNGHAYVWTISA